MSTVTVTFEAESLEDIARKFDEEAANYRTNSDNTHFTLRERRYNRGRAESLEYAARILRQTKLVSS